jgi:HEAT repeat protein
MRYCFLCMTFLTCLFLATAASSQDKKKDKETDKKKEIGKDKSGKDTEITEVAGKSFRDWQTEIHHKDPSKREAAMLNIVKFGPVKAFDAVDDILKELERHSSKTPIDLNVRVNGTMALSTIFKYAKEPDPKLVNRAVTVYRGFLKDPQLLLKIRTVQGIVYLGPECREAMPEVLAMAREPLTWEARKEAMQTLGIMGFNEKGAPSVVVMGEVLKGLKDSSYQVRLAALHSITRLTSQAQPEQKTPVFSRLNALLAEEDDLQVVITAHMAIMTLEKKASPKHLNPVIKLMKHKDAMVRLEAVQAIALTGKDAKPALAGLIEAINDPEPPVAIGAINTLLTLDAEEAIYALRRTKNDKEAPELLRSACNEALEIFDYRDKMRKKAEKK